MARDKLGPKPLSELTSPDLGVRALAEQLRTGEPISGKEVVQLLNRNIPDLYLIGAHRNERADTILLVSTSERGFQVKIHPSNTTPVKFGWDEVQLAQHLAEHDFTQAAAELAVIYFGDIIIDQASEETGSEVKALIEKLKDDYRAIINFADRSFLTDWIYEKTENLGSQPNFSVTKSDDLISVRVQRQMGQISITFTDSKNQRELLRNTLIFENPEEARSELIKLLGELQDFTAKD